MTRDSRRFLQPEAISRIARLEITARGVVEGFLAGMHRSPYFGQSIEFAQHREYVPGDDYRRIDWKAWSKTDKYYVKQYEEETNLRTLLLVDCSESMQFASGDITKYEYASGIAASLGYLLLRQHDGVGLSTFDSEVRTRVAVSSKQNHWAALLAALDHPPGPGKTGLAEILGRVASEQAKKGLIVLISDLLTPTEGLFRGLKLLSHRGHDVMLFQILDDAELSFPYAGMTRFEGLEAAGDLLCDARSLREGYLAAIEKFIEQIRHTCAQQQIDHQVIRTSEPMDAALAYYMNHRIGMAKSRRT